MKDKDLLKLLKQNGWKLYLAIYLLYLKKVVK